MKPVQFTAAVPNGEVIFWDVECSHKSLRCAAMSSQLESAAEAMGMRVGIKTNSGCVPRQRVCGCLGVRLTARQSNELALTNASRYRQHCSPVNLRSSIGCTLFVSITSSSSFRWTYCFRLHNDLTSDPVPLAWACEVTAKQTIRGIYPSTWKE